MDETLSGFLRHSIRSVWNIELLLLLYRQRARAWRAGELVRELRASDVVVQDGLASLQNAGLVAEEINGTIRYRPGSPRLDALVHELDRQYRERPSAITRTLFADTKERR